MTTEFFFKGKKSAADFNVWIVHFYSAHKFLAPGALIEVAAAICKRRPYKKNGQNIIIVAGFGPKT
jgi:hypothetical protein